MGLVTTIGLCSSAMLLSLPSYSVSVANPQQSRVETVPRISSFVASPKLLDATGGHVSISAKASNARTCLIRIKPIAPITTEDSRCDRFHARVAIPANKLGTVANYQLAIIAKGTSGSTVATVKLQVSAAQLPSAFCRKYKAYWVFFDKKLSFNLPESSLTTGNAAVKQALAMAKEMQPLAKDPSQKAWATAAIAFYGQVDSGKPYYWFQASPYTDSSDTGEWVDTNNKADIRAYRDFSDFSLTYQAPMSICVKPN